MIRAIAAIDDKRGIAASGGIPWKIPEDIRYFRDQTTSSVVVMGWATYEEFAQPLSGRRNIVVSREEKPVREGFELVTDVAAFLQNATDDIWIIGGAGLFASTLEYCDELRLTHVQGDFNCDRFFPAFAENFQRKEQSEWKHDGTYTYRFAVYARK